MKKIYKLNIVPDEYMINEEIDSYKTETNYFEEEANNFITSEIFYKILLGKLQKQIDYEEKLTGVNSKNTSLNKLTLETKFNSLCRKN